MGDELLAEIESLRQRGVGRVYYDKDFQVCATQTEEGGRQMERVWFKDDDPVLLSDNRERMRSEYIKRLEEIGGSPEVVLWQGCIVVHGTDT